jgi:arylsulfatase A-like enzyme
MKQNVFLIVIDSFRADKIYGKNNNSITPNFDKLINSGIYFENSVSTSDATLLNWAGMFTGKNSFKTGIRSTRYNKLNDDEITLFTILKKLDYDFFGYIPNLGEIVGLFPNFKNNDSNYGDLTLHDGLGEKIINQISNFETKKPWFFYIHLEELHFPISVPKQFSDKKFGKNNYERQISHIDFWIGKFLENLNLKETLVIVTSDHGIFLPSLTIGENIINLEEKPTIQKTVKQLHSILPSFIHPIKQEIFLLLEKYHKYRKKKILENLNLESHQKRNLLWQRSDLDKVLFDDLIRVPLIYNGGKLKNPKKISQLVRIIDIFPTILDILEIPNSQKIDGRSVKPLMEGKILDDLPAFIESTPYVKLKSNDVMGIRTSKYKYFRDKENSKNRVFLFDLENDPNENNNIAKNSPNIILEMEFILDEILNDSKEKSIDFNEEETKSIEEELKRLGYM